MSVTALQQQPAPACGFGGRMAGGADSAYLPYVAPDPFSAAFNRDHSSPVDSPDYTCGSSDLKTKSPVAEESRDHPSSAHVTTFSVEKSLFQLSIMVPDTNNGAATKTDSSEFLAKENRDSQHASMQSRDPGITNLTNTSKASDFLGISEVSEFDLESFLRDFPKSKPISSERAPVRDYVPRVDEMSRSALQKADPYPKPALDHAPKPTARPFVNTSAKAETAQDASKNVSKKEDEGANSSDGKTEASVSDEDDYHFNSQLASRLKSSIQSEFLSKELFPCAKQESRARTLDDIMRDYGINAPCGAATAFSAQVYKSSQFVSATNVSANNDGARNSSMDLDSFRFSRPEVGQGAAVQKLEAPYGASSSYQFSNDVGKSLALDPSSSCGIQMKPMNFSQNNETEAPAQKQEELRSFGTSVDVSSGNAHAMAPKYQSGTRSSTSYNVAPEKPSAFSGDISFAPAADFKKFESQAPQATASYSGKYSISDLGKQKEFTRTDDGATAHGLGGELGGSFSPSRSNNFRLYNQLGAADALGFSLQAEKQRLRNIDAMISTTPIHSRYNDVKPYKFTTSHSFVASDFDSRRRYSTPSLGTSTYPYRAEINSRMEWSTGGAPSAMGKSVSAPTYEYSRNITTTGSSVDAQYYPSSAARETGSGRNYQYNNCTYMDKSMMDKKVNIKDAAGLNKKKMTESSFKPAVKSSAPRLCRGSPTRSAVMRPNSATSAKAYKDSGVAKRKQSSIASAPRACVGVGGRKKANTNESRINDDLMAGYDFVRDLNKMWQQSIHNLEPKKVPAKPQKYLPYKPATMEEIKNQDRPGATAEHGAAPNHKAKNKSSWSAAFDPSNSPMLDLEAAMSKWASPSAYGHGKPKPATAKQKAAGMTKSYTAAASCLQPKSILKNMGSKSALTRSSTTITPARTSVKVTPTSSKNYPVTTAQMFAGLAFKKKSQAAALTGPKCKNAKVRSKTPLL